MTRSQAIDLAVRRTFKPGHIIFVPGWPRNFGPLAADAFLIEYVRAAFRDICRDYVVTQ